MRSTISRLRKRIREAGAPDDVIVTRAPGYLLDVPAEATDVFRLERLVAEGRTQLARRHPDECVRLLSEAEELWRGPAYSEVRDEPFARAEARRLEELRLLATETRMDAELTLGRHEAVTGELETLTSANPMRERLWSQRMLALYRCWPAGGGAAGVPGPAGHPGRRVGNRAGARRGLVGARRPRPGPGPGRRDPARNRHRAATTASTASVVTRLPGPGAGVPARGTPGRPGQRVGAPARLVDVGRPGRRAPPPGRR